MSILGNLIDEIDKFTSAYESNARKYSLVIKNDNDFPCVLLVDIEDLIRDARDRTGKYFEVRVNRIQIESGEIFFTIQVVYSISGTIILGSEWTGSLSPKERNFSSAVDVLFAIRAGLISNISSSIEITRIG